MLHVLKRIDPHSVHIWLAETHQFYSPDLLEQYILWLDEQERTRYERFKYLRDRHEYLIAHALLRSCLSHYGERKPEEWRFSSNPWGKPEICGDDASFPIRFNLSHTHGLAACAITLVADVGIDVEYMARDIDWMAIAKVSCHPTEMDDLYTLPQSEQRQRFYDLWTLKEAYTKALGRGLSFPFQEVIFRFGQEDHSLIQVESTQEQELAQDWTFLRLKPTESHRLAIALRSRECVRTQLGVAIPGLEFKNQIPMVTDSRTD